MAELLVATTRPIESRATLAGIGLAGRLTRRPAALAITGPCRGAQPRVAPGDVVVASELRSGDGAAGAAVRLRAAALVAAEVRRLGLTVHLGPVRSVPGPGHPQPQSGDELAVDSKSWSLSHPAAADGHPLAVVLAVSGFADPTAGRVGGSRIRGLRTLRRVQPALAQWAAACRPRQVILAGPRSFCAGVERAIEVVERALERYEPPVYVRRQIVHNTHVVRGLESRGARFVQELDEVPEGATVVLAAHGVAPAVRAEAAARRLTVIDATCPLVAKVHREARRYVARGYRVVLVGHADHEEIEGTSGEAPGAMQVIERVEDVESLHVTDSEQVAYLTQTTLATDETATIIDALRHRFPTLVGPSADDICYATQNRQDAVRAIAAECDVMLVVGSTNSSNTNRLVEVARREGCAAHLVEDETELELGWLVGAGTIGVSAGASAPEALVQQVLDALSALGPLTITEREVVTESVRFTLPEEVR